MQYGLKRKVRHLMLIVNLMYYNFHVVGVNYTQQKKNHELLKDLILDNSNENDIVFDPCCGSGSHCLVAKENGRRFLGVELNEEFFNIATSRFQPNNKK